MSALDDIRATLKRCPKPRPNWQRTILVGESALGSIMAVATFAGDDTVTAAIDGVPVCRTSEFKGWEIRDCDPRGRWHDVDPQ